MELLFVHPLTTYVKCNFVTLSTLQQILCQYTLVISNNLSSQQKRFSKHKYTYYNNCVTSVDYDTVLAVYTVEHIFIGTSIYRNIYFFITYIYWKIAINSAYSSPYFCEQYSQRADMRIIKKCQYIVATSLFIVKSTRDNL